MITHNAIASGILPCGAACDPLATRTLHACRYSRRVSGHSYETLLAAILLLLAGNLFSGF